jgi:hypothetical protein
MIAFLLMFLVIQLSAMRPISNKRNSLVITGVSRGFAEALDLE